jgi:D-alanyl-D-alanine carboxypeptidase/D-alanyl-D-alanine-endopeptidase (penicillin-binding protein 4)
VAVVVQPVDGAAPILEHNGDAPMNPASVMKLVTTYAALEILGPGATWQTGAWADAEPDGQGVLRGNLYLKGSGDPDLTLERFWLLLRQLRGKGVRTIAGDLVLDHSLFHLPPRDPAAFDQRPLRAYNVAPDALMVDFFTLRLTFQPEDDGIRFINDTPNDNAAVSVRLVPSKGRCDGWRDRLDLRWAAGRLEIDGSYPVSCGEKTLLLSPLSPDAHVDGLFRALWRELGGSFTGKTRAGLLPVNAKLLATQPSPSLSEIVRGMNKWSNNITARQLFLALDDNPTVKTEESARKRVAAWLAGRRLHFPELVLENGSGLSRIERISANHLNHLLLAAWQSANMPDFLASLPIAAVDGTLQKRLAGTPAAGRARLKTGSLNGVKTAAGYVQDTQGRRYAVTFLINHPAAAEGQPAIDDFLRHVATGGLAVPAR